MGARTRFGGALDRSENRKASAYEVPRVRVFSAWRHETTSKIDLISADSLARVVHADLDSVRQNNTMLIMEVVLT